jgi:hypothetical protein
MSLERVTLGDGNDGGEREAFIQSLVHDHPTVIPMVDIEPAFTPLISICRELPVSAGSLDNLWLTPEGGIVLGECKLMRNPQARREVVAQALDYARAISGMHYNEFESAVQKAEVRTATSLWEAVSDATDLTEAQFIDAIERRLRFGRFMILIIGDGIQEGVEELTDFLQLHAGLHTGLALVDLSIWRDIEGRQLVVPRIPLKTALIERGIVTVEENEAVHILPPKSVSPGGKTPSKPFTVSEPEYFDQIELRVPGIAEPLREFLSKVTEAGVEPEYQKSLVLRFFPSPNVMGSAGYIEPTGKVWLGDAWWTADKLNKLGAGKQYIETVAGLIGGSVKYYEKKTTPFVVGPDGKGAHISDLLAKGDEWVEAIMMLVDDLRDDA